MWWEYAIKYYQNCLKKSVTSLTKCSYSQFNSVGINKEKVQYCIFDSFKNKSESYWDIEDNSILRKSVVSQGRIQLWPSIYINQILYQVKSKYILFIMSFFKSRMLYFQLKEF